MNMMAFRCGNEIVVVDAGMMFPGVGITGVDASDSGQSLDLKQNGTRARLADARAQ